MSIRKTTSPLLFAALALSMAAAQAQTMPDIGGIKLRSPLMAQRAQISKMNPGYQITEVTTTSGKVVGLQGLAFSSVDKRPSDQFLALQDESGNVWYLARAQRFDEGKYVPITAINQALADKYGDYTYSTDNGFVRSWSFTPDEHKLMKAKEDRCGLSSSHFSGGQSLSKVPGLSFFVPSAFYATCGVGIRSYLDFWSRDAGFATGYVVTLADIKTRFDVLDRQNKAEAAARKKESDAMKDNKVKL